jgi:hypothetical protein
MAIIKIQDASVTRVNSKGFGVQVKEADRGDFKGARYTVWFKEFHGLSEGDTVSLSGFLGAKVSEWTDKEGAVRHTVELSVNSPKLDGFPAKESAQDSVEWPPSYNADSEVPF